MRSELVYAAGSQIENRFLLASTIMRAVRKLHVDATRTEDTINNVITTVANGHKVVGALPQIVPPPVIDALIITPAV